LSKSQVQEAGMAASGQPTFLMVEECFEHQDGRFLELLRWPYQPARLAAFADRWKRDPRPWAREQKFAYLRQPLSVPGHQPVVKRLFKQAEEQGDHELVGAFLVSFDRLVRRRRRKRIRYEYLPESRQLLHHEEERIELPRNSLIGHNPTEKIAGRKGELTQSYWDPSRDYGQRLFSYATRRYLRRRAWRYFRRLAKRDALAYVREIAKALARFEEIDFKHGEDLLESWGFMNACFRGHSALRFTPAAVKLVEGRSLAELSAAPYRPQVWQTPEAAEILFQLLLRAGSRPVRTWARQMLEQFQASVLTQITPERLLMLLENDDPELQQFGANLLSQSTGAANWPIATWLKLLETKDQSALAIVCEQFQRHVRKDRLDLMQCLSLATARSAPVARLGLAFLKEQSIITSEDRRRLVGLRQARCGAVGGELAAWACSVVGTRETYDREVVVALLDCLMVEIRQGAWQWLAAGPPIPNDPVLWCRLLETPYEDLRLAIVDHLQHKASLPGTSSKDLTPIWTAVLVGVHRGGRQKQKAIDQMARAMVACGEQTNELLPVLTVAVRSIRKPEMRAGLAAIASLVDHRPDLEPLITRELPELILTPIT
jgi:hypothetical protein